MLGNLLTSLIIAFGVGVGSIKVQTPTKKDDVYNLRVGLNDYNDFLDFYNSYNVNNINDSIIKVVNFEDYKENLVYLLPTFTQLKILLGHGNISTTYYLNIQDRSNISLSYIYLNFNYVYSSSYEYYQVYFYSPVPSNSDINLFKFNSDNTIEWQFSSDKVDLNNLYLYLGGVTSNNYYFKFFVIWYLSNMRFSEKTINLGQIDYTSFLAESNIGGWCVPSGSSLNSNYYIYSGWFRYNTEYYDLIRLELESVSNGFEFITEKNGEVYKLNSSFAYNYYIRKVILENSFNGYEYDVYKVKNEFTIVDGYSVSKPLLPSLVPSNSIDNIFVYSSNPNNQDGYAENNLNGAFIRNSLPINSTKSFYELFATNSSNVIINNETDTLSNLIGIFELVSVALVGVVAFMNFQILPGLSLGALVFLPFVFMILFAVIKLFKR